MPRRRRAHTESLTSACERLLTSLVADLRASVAADPAVAAALRARHAEESRTQRTGRSWTEWLTDELTQVGASWILSCVFVRFLEDNEFIDPPLIAGSVDATDRARNRLEQAKDAEKAYYRDHPTDAERDWLLRVFATVAELPDMAPLLGQAAPFHRVRPTIEGGRMLLEFFRTLDDAGNELRWSFRRDALDTRFLGDLYQDLSERARKQYALLQTPDFVEEFIHERTLDPAIETFGLKAVRLIDPTCGSGHFLLGAFRRILAEWQRREPGTEIRELVRRTLDAIYGVDLNPFATAIARFRLLVAALGACGIRRLKDAPNFPLHVATGDSLLDGDRVGGPQGNLQMSFDPEDALSQRLASDETQEARRILSQQYHAVVGNPPYITVKDPVLRDAYRALYASCHGKYPLSVPFMERFVDLAVRGEGGRPAGFVGKITANSFMKREFGKPLVERYMPQWDLTTVIDTSGAYIPGHGTPTVVLFLRNQAPANPTVRCVLGIRGEPSTPDDPANGAVWTAILAQLDAPGSASEFVSVEDRARATLASHPWSLGGGSAGDLLAAIEAAATAAVSERVDSIGFASFPGLDDAFVFRAGSLARKHVAGVRRFVTGDSVRDYGIATELEAIRPYTEDLLLLPIHGDQELFRQLWPLRTPLANIISFGGRSRAELYEAWWGWYRWVAHKYRTPLSIAFAFVATHNHFVLDRGGKVFNRSAPVIKLKPGATEEEHFELLALLNSSVACFWGRAMLFPKGGFAAGKWEERLEWDATKLLTYPLVDHAPRLLAAELDRLSQARSAHAPSASAIAINPPSDRQPSPHWLDAIRRSIALQEELDWQVYRLYGLLDEDLSLGLDAPPINLGERAFEIVLARKVAKGEASGEWFARHGSTPITEVPSAWPPAYRALVERRIALIESDDFINLLERPEHKRRWQIEPWEQQLDRALREALLDKLEALPAWRTSGALPRTVAEAVADLEGDPSVVAMAQLLTQNDAPNLVHLYSELVLAEAVPFTPSLYLNDAGMRKRAEWEESWRLQDLEDPFLARQEAILARIVDDSPAGLAEARKILAHYRSTKSIRQAPGAEPLSAAELDRRRSLLDEHEAIDRERRAAIGGRATPPVPPKYKSEDVRSSVAWGLRGALDVAKERFILYPDLGPGTDASPLIGWAGWDHARQAEALGRLLLARSAEGWPAERLLPLLQGLDTLVPWLQRWHRETPIGDLGAYYREFLTTQATRLGVTLDTIRAWRPTAPTRGRRARAAAGAT